MQIIQVRPLSQRRVLNHAAPALGIGEAGAADGVEGVVFGFYGDDGAFEEGLGKFVGAGGC